MRYIYKEYKNSVAPKIVFECRAKDILEADKLFMDATGINICKSLKGVQYTTISPDWECCAKSFAPVT